MSGVAKKDFVGMYPDPSRTQPPRDITSYGRGEHSDNNQIKTGANFECGGRYARIAPGGYYREAHADTERKAILAGLNWLTHCSQLARVHPGGKQSGTIRNFRKIATLAQQWWLAEGAAERCAQLLADGDEPPLMFYLIWSDYTRLAKQIAEAAIFGSSIDRSAKLVSLPADLIPRFEAAADPNELLGT